MGFFRNLGIIQKKYVFEGLYSSVSELNHKQDIERKALLKAFKNAGIKCQKLGDGTIRYWYKSHSAKSLNRSI